MASMIPALSKIKSKPTQSKPYANGQPKRMNPHHPPNHSYSKPTTQPAPLPPPQAKQPPINPPKPHSPTKQPPITKQPAPSKPKSSSHPTQLTIVFYGHRQCGSSILQSMDGDFISEIRFNKVVYVQSLRICNLQEKPHAQLLPDFVGRTQPQNLDLFVSARDCSNKERSFVPLVSKALKFNVKADGKKSKRRNVTNQKIPTDHMYIRGKFNSISLIVYGYIDDKLTQTLKSDTADPSGFNPRTFDSMFLLDTLNEFEFNGVGDQTASKDKPSDIINIPKKSNDADGMLFDPSVLATYSNLKVLRQYDAFDGVSNAENMVLMSKVCQQLLDLYPVIQKIQTIQSIENKIGDKDRDKRQQFVELRDNVLNLLCSGMVCVEIIHAINEENIHTEYTFVTGIIDMCCEQMTRRLDIAIYLDFLFVFLKRREIKNAVLLLQCFIQRSGMNGHCILYDLILDPSIACITRVSVIKLLSVLIESEYGMRVFLRESDVSMIMKQEAKDDDNDIEMTETKSIMSGLQILVQLTTTCNNDEIIDAIQPIFQQVSVYCRLNEFCEWNEANSTYLIMPMNDARYWQKSLSLMKMMRQMLDGYLADCIQPDVYEHETRLLFKTARSDPCCLIPKTANLATWHIGYMKQFKVIPTLNNYLTILETKIEKLQSAKEHIISNDEDEDDIDPCTKQYTMRHQKIELFTSIKNEIVGILLCLSSTLNGCHVLSEYDDDLFGLFCGLNQELKENKAHRHERSDKAQILSYYGTPRLSQLRNDSANNRPIRGKDVCNAICRRLQVLVLIHHMNHAKKESTAQLRALYLLDLLTNYKENMESIAFGLFYTNSFASICEMIWLAFNPQDRTIITPSGFTGQGLKLLLYLLESPYFTNIALNPLYFEFFQQLLSDFVTMYQSLQTKLILQKQAKNNENAQQQQQQHAMDVDGDNTNEENERNVVIPSLMETLSMDIQCIVGILQPVVKLREQGFNSILKVFATLIGFESAKTGGDYAIDLEFFHLRFPNKHSIDTDNKSILYSLNSILSVLIESASCPAIIELLASESFVNMVPIVLRTVVDFFKSSPIGADDWYFASDDVLLQNEEEKHWNERCELMLRLLGNTLHLTYIYLNELYVANAFVYPYKIASELFDVQRIISSHFWQHDLGSFTRNNHYFTHIVDPLLMSPHAFVDCTREYSNDYMESPRNPLLQTISESIAGIFAFTLCPPHQDQQYKHTNIDVTDDGIDDSLLYPDKYEMEEFLDCLTHEPRLFVNNLSTLHQCLIHANALGLKQHWIKRLTQTQVQRKLRVCMTNLALSSDFYIHQVLPCVYIQLAQLDVNIAKNILNAFIEMVFSQFLSQQTGGANDTSKWQLVRLCKCLSWMLRDAWSVSLVAPRILSEYINNALFNHEIDETPLHQLLKKINQITLASTTSNNKSSSNHNNKNHNHHRHHSRSSKHHRRSHHSHSRSRSSHSRRKHHMKHKQLQPKDEAAAKIVLRRVHRSKYYNDPRCWVLDPRIVRIFYLKTDGLLTKLFQYISQTDSGLVVAVTDMLQCALTCIPRGMSGLSNSMDALLPCANDIGVILSHLNTVLQAALVSRQAVITEFQWRFWMCCFIIYGRIACLPHINISIVISYFPVALISKIFSSSLSFLKSYANTNMSHNFNLHVSEKLQCLIIIMWFISMIAKHVQECKEYVNIRAMEWRTLYETQLNEIVIVLNKLNEIGFNHIITEIEYCQHVFAMNESFKKDEDNDDIDVDIVLDNDCKTTKEKEVKEVNNSCWIKGEILHAQPVALDELVANVYDEKGRCGGGNINGGDIHFCDRLWYSQVRESTINWWHNNMLSIIRLCSYSTNYDFSVYPPSVYVETVQAIPSMLNAMQQSPSNHHHQSMHVGQQQMPPPQQQRMNKLNKMQQNRMSGTDRFRSNNYTGGRAPSIHVDDFQSDPNMITAHTPTSANINQQQNHMMQQRSNKMQSTTIHVAVPNAAKQYHPQTILVPSRAAQHHHHHRAHAPHIIQSSAINPMAAALLQQRQAQQIAAAQQQINQMNQINLIRNAAAQQQQQQHLLRR
eukprot:225681_1